MLSDGLQFVTLMSWLLLSNWTSTTLHVNHPEPGGSRIIKRQGIMNALNERLQLKQQATKRDKDSARARELRISK